MTRKLEIDPASLAKVKALAERRLTPEELAAWADSPIGSDERAEIVSLVTWFKRRYPTPAARLAWARAQWRSWSRSL